MVAAGSDRAWGGGRSMKEEFLSAVGIHPSVEGTGDAGRERGRMSSGLCAGEGTARGTGWRREGTGVTRVGTGRVGAKGATSGTRGVA